MKLTNKQIYEGWPYLNALAMVSLSPKIGFRIGRLLRKVKDVVIDIEAEQSKLAEKHGEKDDAGKLMTFNTAAGESTRLADPKAFNKERDELLAEETELDFEPITLKDLGDVPLAPNVFAYLDWFITE